MDGGICFCHVDHSSSLRQDKTTLVKSSPLLHFLVYRTYSENVVLIKLSPDAIECEASVVMCSANTSLSTQITQSQQMNHGESIPLFPCFLYFQWQIYKCCNLRWAMWCSHIVLAIEHGCSIGNAHGKKCQR